MSQYQPLTNGDLSLYLSSYPPEVPIHYDLLSEEATDGDYSVAPINVGESFAHMRTMPEDDCAHVPTHRGSQVVIGVMFAVDGPIFILDEVPIGSISQPRAARLSRRRP